MAVLLFRISTYRRDVVEFEKAVQEAPDAAERPANLGLCYAIIGRRDAAIREGRRAVELKPESRDASDGAIMNCYLALIYARDGENNLAIPLIDRLLRTPGAVDSGDYSITVNALKFRGPDSQRSVISAAREREPLKGTKLFA